MLIKPAFLAATLFAGLAAAPAYAGAYGVFSAGSDADAGAVSIIEAQGDTASVLTDLTAASLQGIDVLFLLNSGNNAQLSALAANAAAIRSFTAAGGVFALNDRNVTNAATTVPGASGISFTRMPDDDVEPGTANGLLTGPGGVIDGSTLDNGGNSYHGYVDTATLPAGASVLLTTASATQAVSFSYGLGAGSVYYSTIPLDYYLANDSESEGPFTTAYAPNLVAYLDTLTTPTAVPEPASLAIFAVGLLGLCVARRRTA